MGRQSLQQMLEDLASKVRMLERERREGVARIQALECEVGELAAVIAQASAKVDEMLNEGRTADVQQQEAVNVPATSTAREQLGGLLLTHRENRKSTLARLLVADIMLRLSKRL